MCFKVAKMLSQIANFLITQCPEYSLLCWVTTLTFLSNCQVLLWPLMASKDDWHLWFCPWDLSAQFQCTFAVKNWLKIFCGAHFFQKKLMLEWLEYFQSFSEKLKKMWMTLTMMTPRWMACTNHFDSCLTSTNGAPSLPVWPLWNRMLPLRNVKWR